jgi:hypothetical protein
MECGNSQVGNCSIPIPEDPDPVDPDSTSDCNKPGNNCGDGDTSKTSKETVVLIIVIAFVVIVIAIAVGILFLIRYLSKRRAKPAKEMLDIKYAQFLDEKNTENIVEKI